MQYQIRYVPVSVDEKFEKIMTTYLVEKQKFGYDDFGKEFGSLYFSGKQVIQKPNSISKRSGTNSFTSKWETDVLDKLTRLIK